MYAYRQEVTHNKWLVSNICKLQQRSKLCDVVIIAGTKRIPAHRLILSIGCKYFHDMFTLDLREANQREITIEGVDGQAMENLINSMYTGKLTLNESNIENLISAADMMCMDNILKAGISFLAEQLHPSNCLGIRDFAIVHSSRQLTDKAHRYTMNHVEELVTNEEFLRLPLKQVCQLFDDNRNFYVSNIEVTLLKAALNWLTNNDEDRKQHAPELLSCIKLNTIQQEMLSEVLQANPFLRDNQKCKQIFEAVSQDPVMAISHRRPMPKISIKINQVARLWWSFYCLHPNRAIAELSEKLCVETCDKEHKENCYSKLLFLINALATETELVVKNHSDCAFYQVSRIVNLLNKRFNYVSDQSQQLAIKCFAKWTERGLPLDDCKDFMSNILNCATKPDFFEIVSACMVVICTKKEISSTASRDGLAREVLSFRYMLQKWIAENKIDSITGLTHWTCACVRTVTENSFEQWFTAAIFDLFDFVADLTALPLQYPVEERSTDICFELWRDLVLLLPNLTDVTEWRSHYQRLHCKLLRSVLTKCRYPINDLHLNWSAESRRLHRTYRSQSFQLVCVISQKIGPDKAFQHLLWQFNESLKVSCQPNTWDLAEPWLFGICAVYYWHDSHDFPQLSQLVDALIAAPTVSNVIGDTIFILVSILASYSWIEEHPDLAERLFSKILKHIRDSKDDRSRTAVDALIYMANECLSVTGFDPTEYFNEVLDLMLQHTIELHSEAEFRLLNSAIRVVSTLDPEEHVQLRKDFEEICFREILKMLETEQSLGSCYQAVVKTYVLGVFQALCLEWRETTSPKKIDSNTILPISKQLEETLAEITNHWIDCLKPCNLDCCSDPGKKSKANPYNFLDDLTENGNFPLSLGPKRA